MKHRITIDERTYNPPQEVLNRYLFTRKKERTIAGITMPGLFSVYNFHETLVGIILILGFETAAIYIAIEDGLRPLVVIILMAVDFVLAFLAHLPKKSILIAKNQRIVATNNFNHIKIGKQIWRGNIISMIFAFSIIFSAFVKIFFILRDVYDWEIGPETIFIIVAYLIAAFLHIFCTGDFIHTIFIEVQNYFAFKKFEESNGDINQAIELLIPLTEGNYVLGPIDIACPKIERRSDGIYIVSPGVPDDKDLHELVLRQTNVNLQAEIIRKGIEMQLMAIGAMFANSQHNQRSKP